MRMTLLLLALTTALSTMLTACAGGDEVGSSSRERVEASTTERAQEAIPLVSEALGATGAKAAGRWQSCMAISWRYGVFASLKAAAGETASQLDAVRSALTGAGYVDDTQVDGHVTATRDDTTVDVQPSPIRGKRVWTVTVQSSCADYDGDDRERVENDTERPLDGM